MKHTLALCMIVKNTKEEIARARAAVSSVEKYVDAAYLTLNGVEEHAAIPADAGKIRFSYVQWTDDFAACRDANFKQAREDWILWIDADDLVQKPENLRSLVDDAERRNVSGFFLKYLYDKDERGRVTAWHWKMRLIKNDGHGHWVGRIHEDFLQKRSVQWVRSEAVVIDHQSTGERRTESVLRNIRILLDEIGKQGLDPDPRLLFYLGTAFMQTEEPDKALNAFSAYLERSGWDDERYEVWQRIGDIHVDRKDYQEARKAYMASLDERPDYPDAYFNLARVCQLEERHDKAVEWSKTGFTKKRPNTNIIVLPRKLTVEPSAVYAFSLMHLGKLDDAAFVIANARKFDADDKYLKDLEKLISHLRGTKEMAKSFVKIAAHLKDSGQAYRIPPLIQAIPTALQDNVMVTKLKQDFLPPLKWPLDSVVFLCGNTAEPWSPKNLDAGGIGGSETAVIHLARRFARAGKNVTVYNWCGDGDGEYDGVAYKNYWTMRATDRFDTLVIWRAPEYLDYDFAANRILLDLHDVPNPNDFTPERLEKVTRICVKSRYHRSLLPMVPDAKIAVIPNGIDVERYKNVEWNRNPISAIYSSSPNRGLDILLDLWPRIREAVPGATVRVFYGWKTFYELQKHNPASMKWMKRIQAQMESLSGQGVIDMGRVGQKELSEWQKRSGVWLYPTYFPEISCITAMEVQAGGCIPVCTDFAALDETVQRGRKVSGDIYLQETKERFLRATIEAMGDGFDRKEMSEWARSTFSWDAVADQWLKLV